MITIKSHFAFSGINIPSTINCSINSYFKEDQFIQQIDFPTTSIVEFRGQNYIKSIINNNLKTLDNNLTLLQKYPNDSELASETIELLNALKQINKHFKNHPINYFLRPITHPDPIFRNSILHLLTGSKIII
jgi:hypothetical protein